MKTKVVNVRDYGPPFTSPLPFIYVGRRMRGDLAILSGHALANPFKLRRHATSAERADCLAKYRDWIQANPIHMGIVERLAEKVEATGLPLACWCAPLACHADYLAALIDMYLAGKELI